MATAWRVERNSWSVAYRRLESGGVTVDESLKVSCHTPLFVLFNTKLLNLNVTGGRLRYLVRIILFDGCRQP